LAEARGELRGAPPERRVALRAEAVAAARAIIRRWPGSGEAVEAGLRGGELLRAGGQTEAALELLLQAAAAGRDTEVGERARYEAAHVLRRAGRVSDALEEYRAVARAEGASSYRRGLAELWSARCLRALGRADEAEQLLRRRAPVVEDPLTRVRLHDELIELLVEADRLAGACGWLAACKRSVSDEARELTQQGARVRAALLELDGLELLRAAIARRMEAAR
jgi:tetratricopeptide (TPR) repeat protein